MMVKTRKLSLLDVIISLPTDPGGIMWHLLQERRRPPYMLLAPICVFLVLVGPALYYKHSKQMPLLEQDTVLAVITTLGLTAIFATLLISVLFRLTLVATSELKILASLVYPVVSLIPLMLAFYLGNFLASGELSILYFFVTGIMHQNDWFVELFPTCARAAIGVVLFFQFHAIRAMTNSKSTSALLMTLLTIPLIIGSFATALTIADSVFNGAATSSYRFVEQLVNPPTL